MTLDWQDSVLNLLLQRKGMLLLSETWPQVGRRLHEDRNMYSQGLLGDLKTVATKVTFCCFVLSLFLSRKGNVKPHVIHMSRIVALPLHTHQHRSTSCQWCTTFDGLQTDPLTSHLRPACNGLRVSFTRSFSEHHSNTSLTPSLIRKEGIKTCIHP